MPRPILLWILPACIGSLAACARTPDLDAARAALRATDEAWAAAVAEGADLDLIVSYWADDARVYPGDTPVLQGKEAIREHVRAMFATPGIHMTWQPQEVVVAASGDFGATTGTNEFSMPGPDGSTVTSHGYYLTVWRKNADGKWKSVFDMGTEMP
jgi:uncharacterized protein (TIGR02246 family)